MIDLHIVRAKTNFFDVVRTEGYPVASKKVARMIRDVKEFLDERGLKYEDDIEPHLDQGIETANYLRSINCPATLFLHEQYVNQSLYYTFVQYICKMLLRVLA